MISNRQNPAIIRCAIFMNHSNGDTMGNSNIIVYGVNWCSDCHRARRFLDQNTITYNFVNIDKDSQGEEYVLTTNKGMRSVPTIVFQDGSILVEPSNRQLAHKLGLEITS